MADVLIQRFSVRHNDQEYGVGKPGGNIISGLSPDEAEAMVKASMGDIIILKISQQKESLPDLQENTDDVDQKNNSNDQDHSDNQENQNVSLPDLSPEKLVKAGNK